MYYRRKILLSLLEIFDNQLESTRLQKLLMLLTKRQDIPSYDFVPYKYGCYSFQATADLRTMVKYDQVKEAAKKWIRVDNKSRIDELKEHDIYALKKIKQEYGNKTISSLLKKTYQDYPFYAINSQVLDSVLSFEEKEKVYKYRINNIYYNTCYITDIKKEELIFIYPLPSI